MTVEIHVYRNQAHQATGVALYEGSWPVAPVVGDVIAWEHPRFIETSEPKLWRVIARELHHPAEGFYIDVFVERIR